MSTIQRHESGVAVITQYSLYAAVNSRNNLLENGTVKTIGREGEVAAFANTLTTFPDTVLEYAASELVISVQNMPSCGAS